jgi:hypothetical protein
VKDDFALMRFKLGQARASRHIGGTGGCGGGRDG